MNGGFPRAHYTNLCGVQFTQTEMTLLYATICSENAQTFESLRKHARADKAPAIRAINKLIVKGILKPIESYDDRTLFGFAEGDLAQAVYCEIYQVPPIE